MIVLTVVLGCLGFICLLLKRTALGIMIGVHLIVLGTTVAFVFSGIFSGMNIQGQAVGVFVTISGMLQLLVGFSLSLRLFYLKKRIGMDVLRSLKY